MFEGVVASLLNKYLGKYVQNLDAENLNIGIFGGDVELYDLRLKPEALAELDLPIEVKAGFVGKLSLNIPWTSLYTSPVIADLEEVYVLAAPISDRKYDADLEKQLLRAHKRSILESLEVAAPEKEDPTFLEKLVTTITNNLQIFIRNIHIRYEDTVTDREHPIAFGITLHNLSAETTNNKWKPTQLDTSATTVYKIIKLEELSVYMMPHCTIDNLLLAQEEFLKWKMLMKQSLITHTINGEKFTFVLKPLSAVAKVIINKSDDSNVPKLLVDFVLPDMFVALSRQQLLTLVDMAESFRMMNVNRQFRKFNPEVDIIGNASAWWHYAYKCVLEEYIRPYSWSRIKAHRKRYREYKSLYKNKLRMPKDIELLIDLQRLEDQLDIPNILMAREEAKLEIAKTSPSTVRRIHPKPESSWWFSNPPAVEDEELYVPLEAETKSLWSKLSPEEKDQLNKAIGYTEGDRTSSKPAQYIEHKVNLTVANCTVSLSNFERDILVLSWCNLLLSLENRAPVNAFRISARTESFLIEGASIEHGLVPILTADNTVGTKGSRAPHVFSLDFEVKPLHIQADFAVTLLLEPVEVVYHEHAVSEVIGFFQIPNLRLSDVKAVAASYVEQAATYTKAGLLHAIQSHKTVNLLVDIKSPYLVVPEYGTLQQGGSVIVVDFGRLRVDSQLQPKDSSLEDATMTEVEERMYDKLSVSLRGLQVLFADPGADWHTAQLEQETEMHIVPYMNVQVNLFNSIRQDYTTMPKQKVFVTVPALKLCISDEKLLMLLEFTRSIPLPSLSGYEDLPEDLLDADSVPVFREQSVLLKLNKDMKYNLTTTELKQIKRAVHVNSARPVLRDETDHRGAVRKSSDLDELFFSASDQSEEDEDVNFKDSTIFDESTSQQNTVDRLLRFVLGEFVIHLSRSLAHAERPYMMLRFDRMYADVALMTYGMAVHASLGGVQLVDKINTGSSGEYLELISSRINSELFSVVYRMVNENCPDLHANYHNTLRHCVAKISSLSIVVDKSAYIYLRRFVRGLKKRLNLESAEIPVKNPHLGEVIKPINVSSEVVQLSAAIHMKELSVKFCDQKTEYAQLDIRGGEAGVRMRKPRTSVRLSLGGIAMQDCQPGSLYPRILTVEGSEVFDIKYVRYRSRDVRPRNRPIPIDYKLGVRVGRVKAIYLHRFTTELIDFFEPLLKMDEVTTAVLTAEKAAAKQVTDMQKKGLRVELNVVINAPMILFPQNSNSTNLLRLKLGNLTVKNYIKETYILMSMDRPIIDDIEVQLEAAEITRCMLNFHGIVESVHTILEPIMFVLHIKHGLPPYNPQVLRWDIVAQLETLKINLHHEDLKTFFAIQAENFAETSNNNKVSTPSTRPPKKLKHDDVVGPADVISEVMQDIVSEETDICQLANVRLTFDGIDLTLLQNSGDLISLEPQMDFGQGLAQLVMEKLSVNVANFSDGSLEVKSSLEGISLLDISPSDSVMVRKIFHSHSNGLKMESAVVNVTCPPMIDLTFKQSKDNDVILDVVVERIRLNVCIPYFLSVLEFFQRAQLPKPPITPPTDIVPSKKSWLTKCLSLSLENGSRSLALFGNVKKSEVVLFANPTEQHSRILVLKVETMVDYSHRAVQENLVASVGGLEVICCNYASRIPGYTVLEPCQIELTRCVLSEESGAEMNINISPVSIHVSATTVAIVTDVMKSVEKDKDMAIQPTSKTAGVTNKETNLWGVSDTSKELWLNKYAEDVLSTKQPSVPQCTNSKDVCVVKVQQVNVSLEIENGPVHIPVVCVKLLFEASVHDWSKSLCVSAEAQLIVSYFNEKLNTWEPFLEPIMEKENCYRPYEFLVKVFQAAGYPIANCNSMFEGVVHDDCDANVPRNATKTKSASDSSEHDDSASESEMTVIRRRQRAPSIRKNRLEPRASFVSQQGESSDSDTEGANIFEKIVGSFGHMFSSDSEAESDVEPAYKTGEEDDGHEVEDEIEATGDEQPEEVYVKSEAKIIGEEEKDEVDSNQLPVDMAMYVLVDSRDSLQLNFTPSMMSVFMQLLEEYSSKASTGLVKPRVKPTAITVVNKLAVEIGVTVTGDDVASGHNVNVLDSIEYDNAPDLMDLSTNEEKYSDDTRHTDEFGDLDSPEGSSRYDIMSTVSKAAAVSKAFCFDDDTDAKPQNPCRISVHINGFNKLEWQPPKTACTHVLVMSPKQSDTLYCVIANLDIIHGSKIVTLRSPLQVQNCTTYAMNLYYKVSDLSNDQQPTGTDIEETQEHALLTMLAPDQVYNVPLYVAYHSSIYTRPAHLDYEISYNGISWNDVASAKDRSSYLACLPTQWDKRKFYVKVTCTEGAKISLPGNMGKQVPNYMLRIHPPVVLHNYLPYHLRYSLEEKAYKDNVKCEFDVDLDAGQSKSLHNIDMRDVSQAHQLYLEAPNYLSGYWTGVLDLNGEMEESRMVTMTTEFETEGVGNKQLTINVHIVNSGCLDMYLYAPYWLVNKSGLPLQFRGSGSDAVYENATSHDPLMFRFKKHRRKKAKVRVYNSRWSHSFSVDTIGSTGMVICRDKERNRKYRLMVQVELSRLQLTKIVTILPFFVIVNNTSIPLRYMEHNEDADLWMDIAPGQCSPFWPVTDSFRMYVTAQHSLSTSQGFYINQHHSSVLRMSNGGGLRVDVTGGTDSPMTVSFCAYQPGDAPVLIQNMCDDIFIKFNQKCQGQVTLLKPNQQVLYTWDDPTSERTIIWNVYNRKKPGFPAFVAKDGFGEIKMRIQSLKGFRSSSVEVASPKEKEASNSSTDSGIQIIPSVVQDTGSTITDGIKRGFESFKFRTSNGPVVSSDPLLSSSTDEDDSELEIIPRAEMRKKMRTDKVIVYWISFLDGPQRVLLLTQDERVAKAAKKVCEGEKSKWELFLSLNSVTACLMNKAYEEVALLSLSGSTATWQVEINGKWKTLNVELSLWLEDKWRSYQSRAELTDLIEVDFERMQMVKPFFGQICRKCEPGVWLHGRKSDHQMYFRSKIHRLQLDNQLSDAVFHTVFYPAPFKLNSTKYGGASPFIDVAVLYRKTPDVNAVTLQYMQVLVKEFRVKADKGFVMSVIDIFSPWKPKKSESLQLQRDLNNIHRDLKEIASFLISQQQPKTVFEFIHLSPLKFEVSLSLRGTVHQQNGGQTVFGTNIVDFLILSLGSSLIDVKDVELRMAFFERRGLVMSKAQLTSEIKGHYLSQLMQQAYVLILGLDMLGNPYGLVQDFTQGLADFFYEPCLASIKGPEEFADSLSVGVQSIMGHTVGGAFGSAALLTGSLGNTLAILSMDEAYRRKRRIRLQQLSAASSIPESVLIAGKGFVMGVALGLSGVVVKPIQGIQDGGIEGFFKGVGKGIMGLITKPAGGVLDIVSMAFDGVKRAAEVGEEVQYRVRVPRFMNRNVGLRPYSPYQAVGQRILLELDKGQYADVDIYFAHIPLSRQERPDVVLITNRHVFLLEKCRFWGSWDIDWCVELDDIISISGIVKDKLIFKVKQGNSRNPFTGEDQFIVSSESQVLVWLEGKLQAALSQYRNNKKVWM